MKFDMHRRCHVALHHEQDGFTLIEVMITVAIVGILTAIALPSYKSYVERGDRASARAGLMEAQQFMERFYSTNDRYDQDKAGNAVALPARLQSVPAESPKYTISIPTDPAPTVNSYTLVAAPINAVSKCGNLTLDNTGLKGISVPSTPSTQDIANCWK
jgi:type IV pilus assembly protein PilE